MARTVEKAESLSRTFGEGEGEALQAALDLILPVRSRLPPAARPFAFRLFWRTAQYEAALDLGDPWEIGRLAIEQGDAASLLYDMARSETPQDKARLRALHDLWASRLEAGTWSALARSADRRPGPLRLAFLSSDLRNHVVAYFAQPLFQHLDPRFELFVYSSHRGEPDVVQQWLSTRCAYRILPESDEAAAAAIAEDDIDLLVDLGGPTPNNRPGVLARGPARLCAEWLGYPHALGLASVSSIFLDPFLKPTDGIGTAGRVRELSPSFICMSPSAFRRDPAPAMPPPFERNGVITFGSANNPYKFSPRMLRVWARVVAEAPGSRFLLVRPECGARAMRESVARIFAEEGVAAERLEFRAVRGAARAAYADMDISLDTFPLTGGTTTCESLWMGTPVVSLVGGAIHERLSWSILNNAGLEDLAAHSVEDFVARAVDLAGSPDRLRALRMFMRDMIMSRPLGQPAVFARGFYDLAAEVISTRAPPT